MVMAPPPRGRTKFHSPTYLSSGNPCLDFFFHVVPDTEVVTLNKLLEGAWDQDPLKALKLVANLRGVRGTGKSDKKGFYNAAVWLHKNHPKTLASNVVSFVEMGCFNDLLEILSRLLEDYDDDDDEREYARSGFSMYGIPRSSRKRLVKKRIERERKVVVEKLKSDPNFKFLHDSVSDLFAQRLRSDMKLLEFGDLGEISTAAKWCPSPESEFNVLCEDIAGKLEFNSGDGLWEKVLVPLRKAMHLAEVYMKANDWHSIPYDKIAIEDMIAHQHKFLQHDKKRFEKYLARVKSGEAKMGSGELLPSEITEEAYNQLGELLWKRMVEGMGKLKKNCLAICDVSISGCVRDVSLELGVLVSELNQGPWKGKLVTFGSNPKLHWVEGESLSEKVEFVAGIERASDSNLQKVFDVLLEVGVKGKLRSEEMVKRVFIFSDMGFGNLMYPPNYNYKEDLETDYEKIVRKFGENGYGDCVPEIVFWNLGNSDAVTDDYEQYGKPTPVLGNQPGVALVSGYSKNLLTFFSDAATLNPEAVMEAAISGEDYQRLLLLD